MAQLSQSDQKAKSTAVAQAQWRMALLLFSHFSCRRPTCSFKPFAPHVASHAQFGFPMQPSSPFTQVASSFSCSSPATSTACFFFCRSRSLPMLQAVFCTSNSHVPSCNPIGFPLAPLTAAMMALTFPTKLLHAHQITIRVSCLPSPLELLVIKTTPHEVCKVPMQQSPITLQHDYFPSKAALQLGMSVAARQYQPGPSCSS